MVSSGEEAYFALLAADLMAIAEKYRRDIEEIHKIFFQLSCDREKLIKVLDGQKVQKWEILEDLAIKNDKTTEEYRYMVHEKGEGEVTKRRMFLEIE